MPGAGISLSLVLSWRRGLKHDSESGPARVFPCLHQAVWIESNSASLLPEQSPAITRISTRGEKIATLSGRIPGVLLANDDLAYTNHLRSFYLYTLPRNQRSTAGAYHFIGGTHSFVIRNCVNRIPRPRAPSHEYLPVFLEAHHQTHLRLAAFDASQTEKRNSELSIAYIQSSARQRCAVS